MTVYEPAGTPGSELLRAIEKPTILLDERKAKRNIATMAEKARRSGVRFRPHFKTHRSAGIGEWFRDAGVQAITVSSVDMARYFAQHGWKDITIAFPINLRQMESADRLAGDIRLGVLVESVEVVEALGQGLHHGANAWIKVDVGYGRTGIDWQQSGPLVEVAAAVARAPHLSLSGLLAHAGHSYHAASRQELHAIFRDSASRIRAARSTLESAGFAGLEVSVGDTPTCSVVDDFGRVDEVRPGNFVFYDLKQVKIGSCSEQQIAVAVACPVVAKHPERNEIVLYGGAVHLSKDSLAMEDGRQVFGRLALWQGNGWGPSVPDTYVSSLSQEHGIVRTTPEFMAQVAVGDLVIVLPMHSCLLAYLLRDYHTLDGEILTSQSST